MSRHCPVTGEPVNDCDCGACDQDDTAEPWREVPFQPPPAPEAA